MTAPQQFSQYRLEAQLSSDRYGEIYRAVDTVRRRAVALRLLRLEEIGDAAAVSRFLPHALRAADLVHPRLAWVWDAGEAEGRYYLVERYVNGPTLAQRLAEKGPLSWEEAQAAIVQLAQGLDFAHGRGFDLGAVRPQNIWLSPELGAVLGGLGLALGLPANRPIKQREEALYTAPEIWQGRPHSPASDQYALACLLAEMLTGQPLFDAPSIDEIQARHLGELELPGALPPDAPWQVELALERALARQPGERYANSAEFAEAPGKLALRGAGDETERERRAALAQARKLADEQAHRLVEEAARLAALEQARRELEEQLRRPSAPPNPPEASAPQIQPPGEPPPLSDAPTPPRRKLTDYQRRPQARRRNWIVWLALAAVILVLAGLWLSGRLPGVNPMVASPTPSPTQAASATLRPTSLPSSTPSPTLTATLTASATHTRTSTATLTTTPTPAATATETPTPTAIPTTARPTRDNTNDD